VPKRKLGRATRPSVVGHLVGVGCGAGVACADGFGAGGLAGGMDIVWLWAAAATKKAAAMEIWAMRWGMSGSGYLRLEGSFLCGIRKGVG